ncbi:AraC family transcriptional regulator [Listeria valentina]|uniref:AraC family transcriptional regulator n=1 Tax=Listeria valentina TaxID=2705293 RepID=UPI0014311452|nr:AraC family transcriptional regulator [Listeria valentina]
MEKESKLWHEIISLHQNIPIRIFRSLDEKQSFIIPHFHEEIEIIYISNGVLEITDNTSQLKIKSGQFYILNSNIIHSTFFKGKRLEGIVLQISYPFLREVIPKIDYYQFHESLGSTDRKSIFTGHIKSLLATVESQEPYMYLRAYSLLFQIIEMLLTDYSCELTPKEKNINKKYFDRIQIITNYLKQNFHKNISLQELSDLVHLNPTYLSRFLKKNLGLSFYEYLTTIRLEYAQYQLHHTSLPIMQIIEESGFSSYSQFNKEFKSVYHKTPREFRKKL